jgi:hypothetical protein
MLINFWNWWPFYANCFLSHVNGDETTDVSTNTPTRKEL